MIDGWWVGQSNSEVYLSGVGNRQVAAVSFDSGGGGSKPPRLLWVKKVRTVEVTRVAAGSFDSAARGEAANPLRQAQGQDDGLWWV